MRALFVLFVRNILLQVNTRPTIGHHAFLKLHDILNIGNSKYNIIF